MNLITILTFTVATLASAQKLNSPIGSYYIETGCGGSLAKDIFASSFKNGVMTFNQYQCAKSVRMKSQSFSIFSDEGCSKDRQSNGPRGCADMGGLLVRCLKV